MQPRTVAQRSRNVARTFAQRIAAVASPFAMSCTDLLLPLSQARQMLAGMLGTAVDRAKWARYREAAIILADKRFFDAYDMAKLSYVVRRCQLGDTLANARSALWEILEPIPDGDDYENRALAIVQAQLDRFQT